MSVLRSLSSLALAATAVTAVASHAQAATCYRLPFSNPNLSDGFGSTKGRAHPHRGVDFPQPRGKSIPAVATGTVSVVTHSSCLGNVIVIKHADGKYSGYSHLQSRSPLTVGKHVSRGQTVGKVGATGTCAFGAHLHLTMSPLKGGYAAGTVIDPYKYIKNHKCSSARTTDPGDGVVAPVIDELVTAQNLDTVLETDDLDIDSLEEAELAELVAAAERDASGSDVDAVESADDAATSDDGSESVSADDDAVTDEDVAADDGEMDQGCSVGTTAGPGGAFGAAMLSMLAITVVRRRRRM